MFHYNVDYALFHILQYTNRDLYNYLVRTNMCAKIILPSQTLILFPTESEFWYLGMIFPGATIFVEQMEMHTSNNRLWARG
ncbi:hypothetical protein Lalb_Chr11g0074751 [Lupinus albus]|uniref:Uncharacterized protein n=1 Tax=Lupinus albus TaxID=3870 RepID=A0A6A4PTE5_LUPAL|nr:hypothetical protein Lalb_Chr11g0074751 [Lupinus albus]